MLNTKVQNKLSTCCRVHLKIQQLAFKYKLFSTGNKNESSLAYWRCDCIILIFFLIFVKHKMNYSVDSIHFFKLHATLFSTELNDAPTLTAHYHHLT